MGSQLQSGAQLRIVVDAMGGDYAPAREVEGMVQALRAARNEFEVILVGREEAILEELKKHDTQGLRYSIVNATEVITMDDSPTAALKQKRDSSLGVGMRLHQEGKAEAFISAGNTGAVLSASTLILGRVKGVSRPTIGTPFPSEKGVCLLLDAGTNVDCRPQHLYEFGVMGSIYFSKMYKKERPTVALLNVGEEKTKGNELVLEARKLFEASKLNFIGNVEGRDILKSTADVVVCDGFVGNIVLKFGESVPTFLKSRLTRVAEQSLFSKIIVGLAKSSLKAALSDMDPNEHGGVPVLGVNGVSIIGHGSSTAKGIKNMILKAAEIAKSQLNKHIEEALASGPAHPPMKPVYQAVP
jgi:glycerol-3-phosphate acyltransferase PlsX